jgi:hypothetical protein
MRFVEPPAIMCSRKWATPAFSGGSWFEPYSTAKDSWVVFADCRGNISTVKPFGMVFLRQDIAVVISKIKQALLKNINKLLQNSQYVPGRIFQHRLYPTKKEFSLDNLLI